MSHRPLLLLAKISLRLLCGKLGQLQLCWNPLNIFRMGELEPWMDENFVKGVFLSAAGETVNVKVIRDKNSG